ncbi:MAG: hypothetical protein KC496_07500, partial [Anaerolineae bacterium]|nr:hypothetical protein [Anaerolineae bacterium]
MMRLAPLVFDLHRYEYSSQDRLRAILLYSISALTIVALAFIAYLRPENGTLRFIHLMETGELAVTWWVLSLMIAMLGVYFFVRFGQLQLAALLAIGMGLFTLAVTSLTAGLYSPLDILGLPMMMIMATVLLGIRAGIAINAAIVSLYAAIVFVIAPTDRYDFNDALLGLAALLVLAAMMFIVWRMIALARREGSTEADVERLKLAEINSAVTRNASDRMPLNAMLNDILGMLLKNYPDYYHAQVFLLDDAGLQAQLSASTGTTGQNLLSEGHALAVGSRSIIGQVTLQASPIVEVVGAAGGYHRPNPMLPLTQLEAAFPLRINDRVIGALDLQSTRALTLEENDIQSFQSVADSLSLAIDNYRQITLAQKRAEDNRKLVSQTQQALREVERLNQRLMRQAWTDYLQNSAEMQGFDVELSTEEITPATSWTATLADAVEVNTIIQDGNVVAMPLRVRGHVIGAIEFELSPEQSLSPEDVELVREISERFGLAAENTRLLEESLRAAQRE